ncbi:MAG: methionyl-tRNA formyltransferase, partial [Acidobacteria bacterium]|nr:methionyl-tRNA formyltransferase [Acidobacteriota bacterium]
MRLVFCGTPEFAAGSLRAVVEAGHEVAVVLTQPDRPAGRKMELQVPAVKQAAMALGIEVLQPERIKNNVELRERLTGIAPDAIVVVAYGRIIPTWMLELPRFGNINVHGSLLPKYRGAAPIQWAIANGETETGVTTMVLDAGLDTGDVLLRESVAVGPDATSPEMYEVLAEVGARLLVRTLEGLESGSLKAEPQDEAVATVAPILTREDGRIAFERQTAREIYNRWRGFMPWPGAYATFRGKRLIVHRMRVGEAGAMACGEIQVAGGALVVGAAGGSVVLLEEVQMEGKARMGGGHFAR